MLVGSRKAIPQEDKTHRKYLANGLVDVLSHSRVALQNAMWIVPTQVHPR